MIRILQGDCRQVLATLEAESIDACVTDPPYDLTAGKKGGTGAASVNLDSPYGRARIGTGNGAGGFMGMAWDATGVAFDPATWREVFRVLKPGAHLLAFSGTRTYHRMVCAIEDAGFEIRDQIGWVYGSGFPKSLDVSKAIDKARNDNGAWERVGVWLKARREAAGFTRQTLAPLLDGYKNLDSAAADVSNWENGLSCPKWERWVWLRERLGFDATMDAEVWRLNGRKGTPGEAWGRREILGQVDGTLLAVAPGQGEERGAKVLDITAAHSDAARQWQGWGTALKPAFEPLVVAQKPHSFEQLAHIVGGLLCEVDSLARTDTSWSEPLRQLGFSSIALSLSESLADLWPLASKFTTETAIALTTDLRTLRSCLSRITRGTTTPAAKPTDGLWSIALDAVSLSRSVQAKCERLSATTAGEIAIGWSADEDSDPEESRLSPNWRSIVVARKPLKGTVAANILAHGCGALNIDGCRVEGAPPEVTGRGWSGARGYGHTEDAVTEQQRTALGRWPANIILSYPEDEYELRSDVTPAQRRELFGWLHANA